MTILDFDYPALIAILRRSEHDPAVRALFGSKMASIVRAEYYGFLSLRSEGVDAVFNEAPWVLPADQFTNPKTLYVVAFHLRCEGSEGYSTYRGVLPGHVTYGDTRADISRKLGQPDTVGGGGISKVSKREIPLWVEYHLPQDVVLHFQFDAKGGLEMVTVSAAKIGLAPARA